MKLKCTYCKLIHDESQRNQIIDEARSDFDICPSCGCEEATEATLRDCIIDIIGFGLEPQRAELMAMQIEILFKEELINVTRLNAQAQMSMIDSCFKSMEVK